MHSSMTLSVFALALLQSLAAAAPEFKFAHPDNSTHYYPTGTGTGYHPHHTGTGSHPHSTEPHHSGSKLTTVIAHTKTVTWTVYAPCTTTIGSSTSYYSTASIYTTYIPEYETLTLTETCGPHCYENTVIPHTNTHTGAPAVPTTYSASLPILTVTPSLPIHTIPTVTPSLPIYTYPTESCPPAQTVTVTEYAGYKTVTVTAGGDSHHAETATVPTGTASTTGDTVEHGMCKPGTHCYSMIHNGAWNSTMTKTHHHGTGTGVPSGTGYPHYY